MNLPGVSFYAGQSPRGIILCKVNLPGVSYTGESFVKIVLKSPRGTGYHTTASQSPRGIIPGESIKIRQNMTPWGMITRGVNARSSQLGPPIPTPALHV